MSGLLSSDSAVDCHPARIFLLTSDRELLQGFIAGDGSPFDEIVRRHAALVMSVCQRILRNSSDSEDAFQATFLVLARRAKSVEWQESIASWLHDTARRTALKMRALAVRRRQIEAQAVQQNNPAMESRTEDPATQVTLCEIGEILDRELAALPSRFREVFLLSQVEGLSRDEVAERLGVSVAIVKDRLERGRTQLRSRLRRRGVTLTSAAIATWIVSETVQAASFCHLTTATSQAAAAYATGSWITGVSPSAVALAQGVLKIMGFEKLKWATVWLLMFLTAGGIAYGMLRDEPKRFENGLRGRLVAFDNSKCPTMTIALEEFGTLLNLDISAQAEVWVAFEKGKLGDLKHGQFVSTRLASDHRTVIEIHVQGPIREASIKAMDSSGKVVTTDGDDDQVNGNHTFDLQLAPDAILRIGGLPANRSELKPGMEVPLEFDRTGKRINAIEVEAAENTLIEGHLQEFDDTGKLLVLGRGVDDDDQPTHQALEMMDDTIVQINGKHAHRDDLKCGTYLKLRLADDLRSIRAILAVSTEPGSETPHREDR